MLHHHQFFIPGDSFPGLYILKDFLSSPVCSLFEVVEQNSTGSTGEGQEILFVGGEEEINVLRGRDCHCRINSITRINSHVLAHIYSFLFIFTKPGENKPTCPSTGSESLSQF